MSLVINCRPSLGIDGYTSYVVLLDPQAVRIINLMRFNGINWPLQPPTREASKCYQLSALVKYEMSLRKNQVDCQENSGPTE